ncbi:MAG: acetylglutamate kinase [Candidatus Ranarchaeia archaeon]
MTKMVSINGKTLDNPKNEATILLKALPYVQSFRGKTFVVKIGGEVLDASSIDVIMKDIALLHSVGIKIILVHGGGGQVNKFLEQRGIRVRFVKGRRITDDETLKVAEMVYRGRINTEVVSRLRHHGAKAVGLSGVDGNLITTVRRPPQTVTDSETGETETIDFGHVGDIKSVDTTLLTKIIDIGFIPVICSLASDEEGNVHNVNADVVAVEMAIATQAAKLIIMTSALGVLKDPKDPKSLVPFLTPSEISKMVKRKQISGGMIPKAESAIRAIEHGIPRVHIINGLSKHSLLLEIFTAKGAGTMIATDEELKQYQKELIINGLSAA